MRQTYRTWRSYLKQSSGVCHLARKLEKGRRKLGSMKVTTGSKTTAFKTNKKKSRRNV